MGCEVDVALRKELVVDLITTATRECTSASALRRAATLFPSLGWRKGPLRPKQRWGQSSLL
eukprot:1688715-Alexandrium_andersonii.AAC.1